MEVNCFILHIQNVAFNSSVFQYKFEKGKIKKCETKNDKCETQMCASCVHLLSDWTPVEWNMLWLNRPNSTTTTHQHLP